jgi:hypothetical protein
MHSEFKTPVRQRLTTTPAERAILVEAEMTFVLAGVADAATKARRICERFRYRARRKANADASTAKARLEIQKVCSGVMPW